MKTSFKTFYLLLVITLSTSFLLSACGALSQKKVYKIGVANLATAFDPILDGFKAGIEEAGYKEISYFRNRERRTIPIVVAQQSLQIQVPVKTLSQTSKSHISY